MKLLVLLTISLPLVVFAQSKTADELRVQDFKKYETPSGQIIYKITGDASGQELMVFDAHGWKSLRQQTMTFELYGITRTQRVHEITDGDYIYRLKSEDSTYTTRKDMKWSRQASYKTPNQVSEAILLSMGGTQQADAILNGKTCQVWIFEGKAIQEMWIWKGLVLKRKAKLGDRNIETTALEISIDIDTVPNPALFEIPDYFQEIE